MRNRREEKEKERDLTSNVYIFSRQILKTVKEGTPGF